MRTLSTLIGQMSHASQTGILVAPLHYRGPQRLYLQAVSQHGQARKVIVPLTSQAHKDPEWWVSESCCRLNGCPIQLPHIKLTVWSDASKKGLGHSLPGDFHQGPLECGRGAMVHQCLGATSSNIGSESASAVPRVSKSSAQTHSLENRQHRSHGIHQQERGTHSPALIAQVLELWEVALTAGVSQTAQHIPGIQNVVADTASRQIETRTEWTLDRKIFQSICQRLFHTRSGPLCIPFNPPSTQASKQASRQAGRQASRQACKQASKQASK